MYIVCKWSISIKHYFLSTKINYCNKIRPFWYYIHVRLKSIKNYSLTDQFNWIQHYQFSLNCFSWAKKSTIREKEIKIQKQTCEKNMVTSVQWQNKMYVLLSWIPGKQCCNECQQLKIQNVVLDLYLFLLLLHTYKWFVYNTS